MPSSITGSASGRSLIAAAFMMQVGACVPVATGGDAADLDAVANSTNPELGQVVAQLRDNGDGRSSGPPARDPDPGPGASDPDPGGSDPDPGDSDPDPGDGGDDNPGDWNG